MTIESAWYRPKKVFDQDLPEPGDVDLPERELGGGTRIAQDPLRDAHREHVLGHEAANGRELGPSLAHALEHLRLVEEVPSGERVREVMAGEGIERDRFARHPFGVMRLRERLPVVLLEHAPMVAGGGRRAVGARGEVGRVVDQQLLVVRLDPAPVGHRRRTAPLAEAEVLVAVDQLNQPAQLGDGCPDHLLAGRVEVAERDQVALRHLELISVGRLGRADLRTVRAAHLGVLTRLEAREHRRHGSVARGALEPHDQGDPGRGRRAARLGHANTPRRFHRIRIALPRWIGHR